MDMSSLSNGLPRPGEDPVNIAFKEAALSLTTLYKASQGARREGYLDALDELWRLFFNDATTEADVDITRLATWLNERRRIRQTAPNDTTGDLNVDDIIDSNEFETEVIPVDVEPPSAREPSTSPIRTSPRTRLSSPTIHRRSDHDRQASDARTPASTDQQSSEREPRRERERTSKRRVIGTFGIAPDLHKRGRFG